MAGITVRWREGGHQVDPATDVLRFEVADMNRIITSSAAAADVYGEVQRRAGVPDDWQVLILSCFAITPEWTPARLAEGTGFSRYRTVRAEVLFAAVIALWPTEVFVDDVADPRNEVHYDPLAADAPTLTTLTPRLGCEAPRGRGRAGGHEPQPQTEPDSQHERRLPHH